MKRENPIVWLNQIEIMAVTAILCGTLLQIASLFCHRYLQTPDEEMKKEIADLKAKVNAIILQNGYRK